MPNKKQQLIKHKRIATGLFVAMALVYLLMVFLIKYYQMPWMGYLKAFSEAAMVGALADWFAVTALFRHPMGLRIPHTNLIENSKNVIGDNLGDFVTDNFLTSANIRPYIKRIDLAILIANWLGVKKNQKLIETEICDLAWNIIQDLEKQKVADFVQRKAKDLIVNINFQAMAATGLMYAIQKNEHNRLLDVIIPKAQNYVEQNRDQIYQAVIDKKPLLALVGGKAVTNQLISGIHTFLEDIAKDPEHKIRKEITYRLEVLCVEIETLESWKTKFDQLINQFVSDTILRQYVEDLLDSTLDLIQVQLNTPNGTLRNYIGKTLGNLALDLQQDPVLQNKINAWVQQTIYRLALKNTKEVGQLIKNTVDKWDGRELSDKLELEVGKDLQFIRVNGTIVGGLVGLLIYTITQIIL
ncbi:DUF445 domain-containing protein [Myroides sp. LJL119]